MDRRASKKTRSHGEAPRGPRHSQISVSVHTESRPPYRERVKSVPFRGSLGEEQQQQQQQHRRFPEPPLGKARRGSKTSSEIGAASLCALSSPIAYQHALPIRRQNGMEQVKSLNCATMKLYRAN